MGQLIMILVMKLKSLLVKGLYDMYQENISK